MKTFYLCLFCLSWILSLQSLLVLGFNPDEFIIMTESGIQCTLCGKEFSQKSDTKRHIQTVHSGAQHQVNCHQCGKMMKNKQSLGNHLRTMHGVYKH